MVFDRKKDLQVQPPGAHLPRGSAAEPVLGRFRSLFRCFLLSLSASFGPGYAIFHGLTPCALAASVGLRNDFPGHRVVHLSPT